MVCREAAEPVSRIRRAALQTGNLFEISRCEVSMMSTLSVMAGFASYRRHRQGRRVRRSAGTDEQHQLDAACMSTSLFLMLFRASLH